jgi:hypothetical protein
MVFRVIVPTTKVNDIVEWIEGEYHFEHSVFQENIFDENMNVSEFFFDDKLVAQVVCLKFGDGTYKEF